MQVSDAVGFRFQVKTEEFAYHMEIERTDSPDLYKVCYGRGLTNHIFIIPEFVWLDFLDYCKRLGVFAWEEIYDFPSYSGDGWLTAFQFPENREISFVGKDEKPPRWAEFLDFIQFFSGRKGDTLSSMPSSESSFQDKKEKEEIDIKSLPEMKSDFTPDFMEKDVEDYKVKLEDIFTEEELLQEEGNALDRQVAKFSSFVKTGSHNFVNLIIDKFDEDKEGKKEEGE